MAPISFTQRITRTVVGAWPLYRAHRQAGRTRYVAYLFTHAWVWGYMTPWGTLTEAGLAERNRREGV